MQTLPRPGTALRAGSVPVADLFYSFQGEGVSLGRRALFVRFVGCNLTCGYATLPTSADAPADGTMVCDTEYTWNAARHDLNAARSLTPGEIWDELIALDPAATDPKREPVDLLVVTGGEPLIRQDAVTYLAWCARSTGRGVEVETNATIVPNSELIEAGVSFNAGLKLESSAVPLGKRIKPKAIRALQATGRTRWKFVIACPADLQEVAALQDEFGLTEVWLSPEGTRPEPVIERMRWMAAPALAHGWHLTSRAHVLVWGDQRGR
jgi:7-carboxy-7-deazaguanine synthase